MKTNILMVWLLLALSHYVYAQNCNVGWLYTMPVSISHTSPNPLLQFQVKIEVNTAALIGTGKMQPNGNDIRFVSSYQCCRNIPYFIESGINTPNTVIWLYTDSLPANTSATFIMYYGNDTASGRSNATNVFEWWEGFNNPGSKFTLACPGGNALESSLSGEHVFSWQQYGVWISDSSFASSKPLIAEAKVDTFTGINAGLYWIKSGKKQGYGIQYRGTGFATTVTEPSDSGYCKEHYPVSNNINTFNPNIWSIAWVNTGLQQARAGAVPPWITNDTQVVKNQPVKLALGGTETGAGSFTLDWIRVRKWVDNPPVFNFGNEGINPQPGFLGADQTICFGQMVTFDASGNGLPYYSWSTSSADPAITVGNPGLYNVTSYLYNCLVYDYVELFVNPQPPVNGTANPALICAGDTSLLAVTGAANYVWFPSNITTDTLLLSIEHNTPVLVTGTDTNGCSKTDTVIVNVATPDLHFPDTMKACGSVLLNAGNPGSTFLWSTGASSQSISVTSTGEFWVSVVDAVLGCKNSDTVNVKIFQPPTASFTLQQDTFCNTSSVISLTGGLPIGGYYYGSGVNGNMFVPANANTGNVTLYYVYIDYNQCRDTAEAFLVNEICLGINPRLASTFDMYPNPVHVGSNLFLENLTGNTSIRILNAQGVPVITNADSVVQLSGSLFTAGIYFVEAIEGNNRVIKKLIVLE